MTSPAPSDEPARPALQLKPSCTHCAAADTGRLDTGCHGCQARHIAGSQAAWLAAHGRGDLDVRRAILLAFGPAGYKDGRIAVWQWMLRLGVIRSAS